MYFKLVIRHHFTEYGDPAEHGKRTALAGTAVHRFAEGSAGEEAQEEKEAIAKGMKAIY